MLYYVVFISIVTTTFTMELSNKSSRSCTLPMYPTYGTYMVTSNTEAKPGDTMENFIITVTCRRGYGFEESGNHTLEVFCVGGVWSQQMPRCVRFCKLTTQHSVKHECRIPGQGLDKCQNFVPPRTIVIATCAPQYFSANEVEYMTCMDYGIWDRVVECKAECGLVTPQAELQLVGGRFAKFGEFPWHVGVYDKTAQPYEQLCGGSIITNNVVISAAHCFWDDVLMLLPETQFIVATAKLYRKWNDEKDQLAQRSEIKKIKIPDQFHGSAASFQQDIAFLILKSPFTYLPYVRPVCYDFNSYFEKEQLFHGNLGKVAGWGLTAANGGPSPSLKIADLPFVSQEICVKGVPRSFWPFITGDKFCAGYTNGSSAVCKGDSGGGLVFSAIERNRERYYLRGIVSASPRNDEKICNDYTYAAFTKLTAHKNLIIESIAESSPMACNSYLFQCDDGSCVYPEAECNGIDDCKDGSDESYENCTPGAFTTTTTEPPQLCTLPPYPDHGRLEVGNNPNARPGYISDSFVMTLSCESSYGFDAPVVQGMVNGTAMIEVYCFNGEWVPELKELPQCIPVSCDALKCGQYSECVIKDEVPQCICSSGFSSDPSSSSGCYDVNECDQNPCGSGAICKNLPGAYQCKCTEGLSGDPYENCVASKFACSDENPCPKNERCQILGSGGTVCGCQKGFKRDETSGLCEDIDECTSGFAECGTYGHCRNSLGSFRCICPYVACGDCVHCEN